MKSLIVFYIICAGLVLLSGCQSNLSGDYYARDQVRKSHSVEFGMIEYIRPVVIEGTKTPIGAGAGTAVGGLAGSTVGGGRGKTAAAILGAVAGGVAGAAIEESATKRQGLEITVRLDNNRIISVVQEVSPGTPFRVGDRVRILTLGGTTRIAQ